MPKIVRIPKGATDVGVLARAEPTTLGTRTRPDVGTRVADLVPTIGWARLQAEDEPRLTVLCELDNRPARVTDGYGGFDVVDRPGNVGLTPWRGFQPLRIELPLWLDDHANGRSVEPAIDMLEALAGRGRKRTNGPGGAYSKPPRVIVHSDGATPYDARAHPDMRWYVDDLDWRDDEVILNDHGNRVRAPVTVMLLQAVTDERLADRAAAARQQLQARQGQRGARRRYTVKDGDTAISIARRELGDAGRYEEILKLNGLRDPRALRPGAAIRLP